MGDQPTRGGAGDRDAPGRNRRSRSGAGSGVEPLTVEQLLARQGGAPGGAPGRRRAARRADGSPAVPVAPAEPPAGVRGGMPPVPDPAPRAGLPPVPAAPARRGEPLPSVRRSEPVGSGVPLPPVRHSAPVPPLPGLPRSTTAAPAGPDARPVRRSGPVPPLPGRTPPSRPSGPGDRTRRRFPSRPPERAPISRGRRRLLRVAAALAAVVGIVVLYHLGLYFYVDQKIDRVDALATDGPEVLAPALQAGSETYLVVGTGVPGQEGPASVAALLTSITAEGDRAVLVSLPPTALVDTPACRTPEGELRNPTTEAFATSLLDGGPACMVRAVQQLSGLRVDHYLGVDLGRLPGMVDALGGVPVCVVPTAATAAAATPLPPGASEVTGSEASGFLRPGESGSDVTGTAVAERAQRLLTSTMRAAMAPGTFLNTLTLTTFLDRAAEALTVDEQTTLGDLRTLAASLGDLTGDAVQRAGLPVKMVGHVPVGEEQAYVLLDGAGTRALFDSVIESVQVPAEYLLVPEQPAPEQPVDGGAPPEAVPQPEAPVEEPSAATALTVPPAQITVDVLNGTGTTGLAATAAEALGAQGFGVGTVGNEPGSVSETVVRHGPGLLEQARTVAAAVPGAVLQASDSIGDAVQLVLGPGYETVVPVQMTPPAPEAAPETPAAAEQEAPAAPVTC